MDPADEGRNATRAAASAPEPEPPNTSRPAERVIIALDLDAFYVSAVRKLDPTLSGIPLGIKQKGLLATISYEARSRGVRKLASLRDALRTCPEMLLVSGENLSYFRALSKVVYELVAKVVWEKKVEKLGMDELFCDVSVQQGVACDNEVAKWPSCAR